MYWLIFSGYIRQFEHSSRPQWSFVARFRVNMLGPFAGQEFIAKCMVSAGLSRLGNQHKEEGYRESRGEKR